MVMRVITFKIEEEVLVELDLMARSKGSTRSDLIREAIEQYLVREKQNQYVEARRIRVWY